VQSAEEHHARPPIMVVVEIAHPVRGQLQKRAWTPTLQENVRRSDASIRVQQGFSSNRFESGFSGLGVDPYQLASEVARLMRKFPARCVRKSDDEDLKSIAQPS